MKSDFLLLIFIGHFLGDYYFQTDYLVKNQTCRKVILHSFIYWGVLIITTLPIFSIQVFLWSTFLSFIHMVIDLIKFSFKKDRALTEESQAKIYLIDQLVHYLSIFLLYFYLLLSQLTFSYIPVMASIEQILPFTLFNLWQWLLILLLVLKPAFITIRIVLKAFEPDAKTIIDSGKANAGALIGIFERILLLLLLHMGQLTAIGFVLTAKSIARYNKISEDSQFAEYYLLGTLLSSLLVIGFYFLIF